MKTKLFYMVFVLFVCSSMVMGQHIGQGGCSYHVAVVNQNGIVYTWGYNGYGQLGNDSSGNRSDCSAPKQVFTKYTPMQGKKIIQLATGGNHTVALGNNGIVYAWGNNDNGQIGIGTQGNTPFIDLPVEVKTTGTPMYGKNIVQISAGESHTIALANDGKIYGWGGNKYGYIGNNTTTTQVLPVSITTEGTPMQDKIINYIAAGAQHTVAVDTSGKVYSWGANDYGQLGDGSFVNRLVPVKVMMNGVLNGQKIIKIACGVLHTVALASDGKVYTWGDNTFGQLGDNTTNNSNVPVSVKTDGTPMYNKKIVEIAAGAEFTLALASDGTLYTWGKNDFGQLGNGTTIPQSTIPVAVKTTGTPMEGKIIKQIKAGFNHAVALASDGSLYSWGGGGSGVLGNNSKTSSNVPVAVDLSTMGPLPVEQNKIIDKEYKLYQNYPNPFNPVTKISYNIPTGGNVRLSIYDVLGKEVMEVYNGYQEAGYKEISVDCSRLSTGVYYYKLESGNYKEVKKMMLIK